MTKKCIITLIICCFQSVALHLKAETITYDFSSPEMWTTELGGTAHPSLSATISKVYYIGTNDCFVGKNDVYFYEFGGLMLKPNASLRLPSNSDWTVHRVIIHSHENASTSVKVNIHSSHDGAPVSSSLKWETKDSDYTYDIFSSYKNSSLYVMATNSNARISSITIEYTSATSTSIPAPVFTPATTSFSTASLDVTVEAAEGCEVYYTKDGTTPSYTDTGNYVGTKGNTVTINASDSKVTLQAIAVDPTTGKCSSVSSATYTYVAVVNDGSSKAKAYTVAEVKVMSAGTIRTGRWVRGTIYGTMVNSDIKEVTTTDFKPSNIVIGDELIHIPIQLVNNTDVRNEINLVDHPYLVGKEILIQGTLEFYCNSMGVKAPSQYQITYDVPINRYGYATLYLDMPVSVPAGSTAYYCVTDGARANLYPVGNVIPAGVGVILSSTPDKNCTLTYTTETNSNEESIRADNQLIGFVRETVVGHDEYVYYALNAKDGKVGFYIPQTTTGAGFTAKANKAYLKIPAESQAAMFVLHDGADETAIVPMVHTIGDIIYDLQGRAVSSPVPGIYIVGGKKVVIK